MIEEVKRSLADEGFADSLVDGVMPEDFDWRRMVRDYPLPALALAAVGGWVLGTQRGAGVLTALGGYAATKLIENVNQFLGDDVL